MHKRKKRTSWEGVSRWYDKSVGNRGHYYHEKIVIPGVQRLINLDGIAKPSVLDLACGQGVLARALPPKVPYTGIDLADSLIEAAKKRNKASNQRFYVGDVTQPLPIEQRDFTHAAIILALQNIQDGLAVLRNASEHLEVGGKLILVLNHPCFRIPRQTSWGVEKEKKIQYRRVDRYLSPMEIPIQAHPGQGHNSPVTRSFHYPLSTYTQWLAEAGFTIEIMEEWCSDKVSTGGAAKMENRARSEIPLFLAILATKV